MQALVYAIVTTWNNAADIHECLRCLNASEGIRLEIIVVDNGSSDGTPEQVARSFPNITLIRNAENLGFVEGNNIGIRQARQQGAEFVFLLNADAFVERNTIALLVKTATDDARVGLVGPTIVSFFDRTQIYQGGRVDLTRVQPYEEQGVRGDSPFETDYVPGCAVLAPSNALDKIGLLDPAYFSYWEDTDWGVRCRQAGLRSVIQPTATVLHKGTLDRVSEKSDFAAYLYTRNRYYFARKFKARWDALKFTRDYTEEMLRLVQASNDESKANALINGWWAGLTGRTGNQFIAAPAVIQKFMRGHPRGLLKLLHPIDMLRAQFPVRSTLRRVRQKFQAN